MRHTDLNRAMFYYFQSPQLRPHIHSALEQPVSVIYPTRDGKADCRADIVFTASEHVPFHKKALDTVVCQPLPHDHAEDATHSGKAAKRAEERKVKHYTSNHVMTKDDVIPIAMETYGTMGNKLSQLLKDASRVAVPSVEVQDGDGAPKEVDVDGLRSMHIRAVRERLAVALQRGNAGVIRGWRQGCIPHYVAPVGGHDASSPPPNGGPVGGGAGAGAGGAGVGAGAGGSDDLAAL